MTSQPGEAAPRVSIGMPVYNGERFLNEALDSILSQTYRDFELIISDNASTDRTAAICEEYAAQDPRIKYIRNASNVGAAKNYNIVFRLAKGEYFKWAAHDDICQPTFIERCVNILDEQPAVVVCSPKALIIDINGQPTGHYPYRLVFTAVRPYERFRQFFKVKGFHPIFGVIRSSALAETGLIGNFEMADRVLLGELVLWGEFAEVPEFLFLRRKHDQISTKANPTDRQLAAWYDPSNQYRIILPSWRRLVEYMRAIHRSPLRWHEQMRCYLYLTQFLLVPHKWKTMLRDLVQAARPIPSLWLRRRTRKEGPVR